MKKIFLGLLFALILISPVSAYTVIKGDTPYSLWGKNWRIELAKYGIYDPHKLPVGLDLVDKDEDKKLGVATSPVAGVTYTLNGSGITGSATSIILASLKIPQTGYLLQDSDFSDTFYVTFEPGNTKRQEIASCTTVTQNGNGTATLSGCTRGLLPFSPFTASTTFQFPHAGGTSIIFSDPPQLFNEYSSKLNNETVSGTWTFNTFPQTSSSVAIPSSANQLATKYYVDNVGAGGFTCNNVSTTLGIQCLGTVPEKVGLNVSSSLGMAFGPDGRLYQITSSSLGISNGPTGIGINTSTLVSLIASSSPVASTLVVSNASGTLRGWTMFGGDGSDGNLTIMSGTTTVDLGGKKLVILNYNNLTIGGTGSLAFTNAAVATTTAGTTVVIKVRGNFIATSTRTAIDLRGIGGRGGAGGATGGVNNGGGGGGGASMINAGSAGAAGINGGSAGTIGGGYGLTDFNLSLNGGNPGGANVGGTGATTTNYNSSTIKYVKMHIFPGTGGGGGQGGSNSVGSSGGLGGGALWMEVNGNYNVTSTINASGNPGSNGLGSDGACGGGGGGGVIVIWYNFLTTDLGTYTTTGGAGGTVTCTSVGGAGGNGFSQVGLNTEW